MKILYKYGFWLFIIIIITLINIWRITNTNYQIKEELFIKINEQRIASLITSNSISNRKLIQISGENIISNKLTENLLHDSTLAILLYDFLCDKCQENELKRLDSLRVLLSPKGINIIGITTNEKKGITIRQRKIAGINFPIYWVNDEVFYKSLSFNSKYPQIIFVVNNIIISAFNPIPKDDEFSRKYYKSIVLMSGK